MKRVKIHVVCRKNAMDKYGKNVQSLLNARIHPDEIPQTLCMSGCTVWTFQTLINLNHYYGDDIECSFGTECLPGRINLLHYDDFSPRVKPWRGLTVVCRADRPYFFGADYVVEQIKSAEKNGGIFISHWPQPGLKPRDKARCSITTIGYFGRMDSFPPELASDAFKEKLAAHGLSLKVELNDWTDYQNVDIVLCFRKYHDHRLSRKPASKLINTWLAGCVLICDDEPAIKAIKNSPLDYLVAHSQDDIIDTAMMLKNNPVLYQDMVEHGKQRVREYTRETVAKNWMVLFEHIWEEGLNRRSTTMRALAFFLWKLTKPFIK
jgi:hypothetical protein